MPHAPSKVGTRPTTSQTSGARPPEDVLADPLEQPAPPSARSTAVEKLESGTAKVKGAMDAFDRGKPGAAAAYKVHEAYADGGFTLDATEKALPHAAIASGVASNELGRFAAASGSSTAATAADVTGSFSDLARSGNREMRNIRGAASSDASTASRLEAAGHATAGLGTPGGRFVSSTAGALGASDASREVIEASGTALGQAGSGLAGGAKAWQDFHKDGATGFQKTDAALAGTSSVASHGTAAAHTLLTATGKGELGGKVAQGGSAVASAADGARSLNKVAEVVSSKEADTYQKAGAVAMGTKAAAGHLGSSAANVADLTGHDEVSGSIQDHAAVYGHAADAALQGIAATKTLRSKEATTSDKVNASLHATKGIANSTGAGARLLSKHHQGVPGDAIATGASGVSHAADAGLAGMDIHATLQDDKLSNARKTEKIAGASGRLATSGAASASDFTKLAGGSEALQGHIQTGGSAATHTASAVEAIAKGVQGYHAEGATKTQKANAVLGAGASATSAGTKAIHDITKITGHEAQGAKVASVGSAVSGTLQSGTSVTGAIDTWNDDGATNVDRAIAINKATADVGKSVSSLGSAVSKATDNKDAATKFTAGGSIASDVTGATGAGLSAYKTFTDENASTTDKVGAGIKAFDATTKGAVGVTKTIADIKGDTGLASTAKHLGGIQMSSVGALTDGLGAYQHGSDAYKAFQDKDYKKAATSGAKSAASTANLVRHGADIVKATAGSGAVGTAAGQVSHIAGKAGVGVLGYVGAAEQGMKAYDKFGKANKLSNKSDLGKAMTATENKSKVELASSWGIDTTRDDWEKDFTKTFSQKEQEAVTKGDEAEKAFYSDARVAGYTEAKGNNDARKNYFKRLMVGGTVASVDAAGKAASATGTFTAAADGGATKAVGTALETGAAAVRLGDQAKERWENVSATVDARDAMKGYDKKGFFGKKIDAIQQAASPLVDPLVGAGRAAGSAVASGAKWAKNKAKDAGSAITKTAGKASDWLGGKASAAGDSLSNSWLGKKAGSLWSWGKKKASKAKDALSDGMDWAGAKSKQALDLGASGAKWAKNKASAASTAFTKQAGRAADWVGEKAGAASDAVGSAVSSATGFMSSQASAAADAVMASPVGGALRGGAAMASKAGSWVADKAGAASDWVGGKANKAASAVSDAVSPYLGAAREKASAAGKYISDKAGAAKDWAVNKATSAKDHLSDKASAAGRYLSDKAGAAKDWAAEKTRPLTDYASKKAGQAKEAAGDAWGWMKGKADDAWGWMKGKASDAADAVSGSVVGDAARAVKGKVSDAGKYVSGKASDAAQWTKENIWETSDMNWARKLGAFVTPTGSDAKLASTREAFAASDKAKEMKQTDFSRFKALDTRLKGSKSVRSTKALLDSAKDGDNDQTKQAQQLIEIMGVDHTKDDAAQSLGQEIAI